MKKLIILFVIFNYCLYSTGAPVHDVLATLQSKVNTLKAIIQGTKNVAENIKQYQQLIEQYKQLKKNGGLQQHLLQQAGFEEFEKVDFTNITSVSNGLDILSNNLSNISKKLKKKMIIIIFYNLS